MSSPFAQIVAPATVEPSNTTDQPAGFPAASPSAQAAFAALVSKMHKAHPDTPDDGKDEVTEDGELVDDNADTPVITDPKPVRKRKPRVKKDEEPEPATDTEAQSLDFDPVAITLSHSPDEAWVILHNQAQAVENRLNTITSAISEYTQLITDLESEGKALCDASANASRIVDSLTATLVSVADGKPGQVGKVRITVIDGDARVDPA